MSKSSTYQDGRDDASNGEYNPPGNTLAETLDHSTNEFYEGQREEYREGYHDRENEIEHGR
jgi:hypothetical protein